ncbi:MAG: ribosome small subunit-dependent GTPase A [Bacilli bacterium]|nr:ribosome small subunit-dependent GTPase A [Bacilli bacterium]
MEGKITRIVSNLYRVNSNDKDFECRARGKFRHDKLTPLVGDIVEFDPINCYILDIKPRINSLERPTIANIDSALIVTSVKKPDLSLNLLDKELVLCISNNIEPIIVFTKIDLLSKSELNKIKSIMKYYTKIGIKVTTNRSLYKLKRLIKNKTLVLTGQTGAGKSSLLNKLDKNLNLETNEISEALGRGKHTTRHVELFNYKSSFIADTPGFSSLDLTNLSKDDIKSTFKEFNKVSCPYKDCSHTNESECNVKKLVKNKKIMKSRYENYIKFIKELK